ncbi:MAG: DUF3120 domain-containing protein [Synechococcales bacterium]|nr:DUF3120 domain-containing protein [Synechococcales bacterium]
MTSREALPPTSVRDVVGFPWRDASLTTVFAAAIFLISVPVFFQAPLVRDLPGVSLVGTIVWAWLSLYLAQQPNTRNWGSLLTGFTWTWLAGSLYWGWLRWEPLWHLPIEAIALPIALVGIQRNWCKVGQFFYLGSLLGTAVTDLYFYAVDLMPAWRDLMQATPEQTESIFRTAIAQMNTPWGWLWVGICGSFLLIIGLWGFRHPSLHWRAFSGAVLSTILVDGLFWVAALLA